MAVLAALVSPAVLVGDATWLRPARAEDRPPVEEVETPDVAPPGPYPTDETDPGWAPGAARPDFGSGRVEVDLPLTGRVQAGSFPIHLERSALGSPSRVAVTVLPPAAASALGASLAAFRISRLDGVAAPGMVTVQVDYSAFTRAYGGSFPSRLLVQTLPPCAATDPERQQCLQAADVAETNDLAAATLTWVTPVLPEPVSVDGPLPATEPVYRIHVDQ